MRKSLLLLLLLTSLIPAGAQTVWVTGAVTDSISREPLPDVTVSFPGDTQAVITNSYGLFKIGIPAGGTTLWFRHNGYTEKKAMVRGGERLLIALSPFSKKADPIALAKAKAKAIHTTNPNYGNVSMGIHTIYNETYGTIYENRFVKTVEQPLSTFAVDVDRAAYSNIRRFINAREPVPPDAVRIEEMVNYFQYQYPLPPAGQTFSLYQQYTDCPWAPGHHLLQLALRARAIATDSLPPCNLVFLIDVSGSMGTGNKLPLLQAAFRVLVKNLRPHDRVAIVAYAGAPGVVLPSTPGHQQKKILQAIDQLSAGGATAGEAAIKMAYKLAQENFIPGGNNRVIMATDGDFNVGLTSDQEMETLIRQQKESGVLLTCIGLGMKNYKDSKLQTLSRKGNGNFAYIDNLEEASKIFAREFGSTLFTVARDVQAEVTFHPAKVKAWRLIGYENKVLRMDTGTVSQMHGGIVGSGHCAVAIYEIIPAEMLSGDSILAAIRLAYRDPTDTTVRELKAPIPARLLSFDQADDDYRFAAAVALFGLILRRSEFKGAGTPEMVQQLARRAQGKDKEGYREEFIKMIKQVRKQR